MAIPDRIRVVVHYRAGAHHCRYAGKSASSTLDAQTAVERLMDKLYPPGTHRATELDRSTSDAYFAIDPI